MLLHWLNTSKNSVIYKKSRSISGQNGSLPIIAGKVLFECYRTSSTWPTTLVEAYLDDAMGCRQWVDSPQLSSFCENLLHWTTTISELPSYDSTLVDPSSSETAESATMPPPSPVDLSLSSEDSSGDEEEIVIEESSSTSPPATSGRSEMVVRDRFVGMHSTLSQLVLRGLQERFSSGISSSQLISTFYSFCRISSVRLLASKCLPTWLGNPALVEHVGRLMSRIAESITTSTSSSGKCI